MKKLLTLSLLLSGAMAFGAQEGLSGQAAIDQLKSMKACVKCNLTGADLKGADLIRANLSKVNLTKATFSNTTWVDGSIRNS